MSQPPGYSHVEYIFEPHTAEVPHLGTYLSALWERRPFMVALARSDLRSARTSTAVGSFWGVLDPLFQATVYYFLYSVLRGRSGTQLEFLPVLVAGIFLFGLSMAALTEGGGSIRRAKGLMLNSTFPRAMLPVTAVYKSLVKFIPSAAVLAVIFPLIGGHLGAGVFVLPLLFCIQVLMNVGIALLTSTFVVLVPDATNIVNYIGRLLFFATPVIYPVTLLPDGARLLISWQPLFPLFASYQAIFAGRVPSPGLVAQSAVWSVVLLTMGAWLFLRHERQFAMHL